MTPSSSPPSSSVGPEVAHWLRLGLGGLWCALAGYALGNAAASWVADRQHVTAANSDKRKNACTGHAGTAQATTTTANGDVPSGKGMDVAVNTDESWGRYVMDASDLMVAVVACDARAVGFGTLDNDTEAHSTTLVLRCKFQPASAVGGGELSFQIFFDPTENYLRFISKFDLTSADLPDEVIAYTAASWNTTMRYCRLTQCGGPAGPSGPSDGMNLDMVAIAPQCFATQTHAIEWLARLTKVFMSSITRCLIHIRDCRNGAMPFATKDMLEANTVLSAVQPSSSSSIKQDGQSPRHQQQCTSTDAGSSSSSSYYDRSAADEFCPICLERFVPGDLVRRLPCMHVFHKTKACDIDKHLKRNKQCPTCKTPIDVRYDYLFQAPQQASPVEGGPDSIAVPTAPLQRVASQQQGENISEHVADLERMLDGLRESLYNYERMRAAVQAFYHTPTTASSPTPVAPSLDRVSSPIERRPTGSEVADGGRGHSIVDQQDSGQTSRRDSDISAQPHRDPHTEALLHPAPNPHNMLMLPPPPPPPASSLPPEPSDSCADPTETEPRQDGPS